jgi:hypothetical protein
MADNDLPTDVAAPDTTPDPESAALSSLAREDDATRYIEQRTQQENGPDEGPQDAEAEEPNRVEQALEEARERTRQAREANNQLDAEYAEAEQAWLEQQQQEQQAEALKAQERDFDRQWGATQAKNLQLKATNPQLHQRITENLSAVWDSVTAEQQDAIEKAMVLFPESMWAMAARLTGENDGLDLTIPERFDALSNASPQEILQAARQAQMNLQNEWYVQTRIMQDRVANGRRISSAPAPMTRLKGSANPPSDLARAAQKDSADSYIKMRRAQMARDER